MSLRIRFQDGPDAGRRHEFDEDVVEVRFGRDADRCEVAFPTDDTRVGREHFGVRRVLGRYEFVLNGENLVIVDGRPAHDRQILEGLAQVQVGEGGPTLLVETFAESVMHPTAGSKRRQPGVHTRVHILDSGLAHTRRWARFAVAGLTVALVAGYVGFKIADGRIVRAEAAVSTFDHALAEVRLQTKSAFQEIAKRAQPSVYLVLMRMGGAESGVASPAATAWVVGPRTLATNGHVAALFTEKVAGVELVVRNASAAPHEARIGRVEIHPGFTRFPEFVAATQAYDQVAGSFLDGRSLPACDVALLYLADDETTVLGPPLQMATNDVVRRMEVGQPLATIGFPLEGMHKGGVSLATPQPTFQQGILTGVSGFFLEREPSEAAHLLHFSMQAIGGSSGSPVFDREGRVVAILNGGNMLQSKSGVRIIAGVSYGQRIDLLHELQDSVGLAASMRSHEARWKLETDSVFHSGIEGLLVRLQALAEQTVGRGLTRVEERKGTFPISANSGQAEHAFQLPDDGSYVAMAIAENPTDLDAFVVYDGNLVAANENPDYYPIVRFHGRKAAEFQVILGIPASVAPVAYRLRFFREAD